MQATALTYDAVQALRALMQSAVLLQAARAYAIMDSSEGMQKSMITTGTTSSTGVISAQLGSEGLGLQSGQVVKAVVKGVAAGQVTLQIGSQTVQAQSQLTLAVGQNLELKVAQGKDQVILQLLQQNSPATIVAAGVRNALPVQQSLAPLLANIQALSATPRTDLPQPLQEAVKQVAQQLPDLRQLTAGGGEALRQALNDSGLLLESKLAATRGTPPAMLVAGDLKANLLLLLGALRSAQPQTAPPALTTTAQPGGSAADNAQLATLITEAARGAPPLKGATLHGQAGTSPTVAPDTPLPHLVHELTQQTQGALARLQLSQLSSLSSDADPGMRWLTELPVRHGQQIDIVQLQVEERGGRRGTQQEKSWSVNVAFDLGPLGAVQARVTLTGEDQISTMFWAEREETAARFQKALPLLHRNLSGAGLQIRGLACREGEPPPPARNADLELMIVDEKA